MSESNRLGEIVDTVYIEIQRASQLHPPMNSHHEGYAVLLEEVDELWEEIKKRRKDRDPKKLKEEAIQVAAMAVRFIFDLHLDQGFKR